MNKTKEIWMSGFALFSLFFGAGNLILPPFLGANAGEQWMWVVFGFVITAVIIPILGILAHARVQGTLYDLGKNVAPWFSTIFCICIYAIAIAFPAPRTASVTHEMAIEPIFGSSPLLTSVLYFALIFLFVINRSKILSLIGKFLTPIIVLILLTIIVLAFWSTDLSVARDEYPIPFVSGILEGYQTFDAIGGVVVGAVIIISLNLRGHASYKSKREIISKAGLIAGTGLLLIYGGMVFTGSYLNYLFVEKMERTTFLQLISTNTLGNVGATFLSILVSLACFTTGIGIVTGASDYVKGIFKNSQKAYILTAFFSCVLGVLVGNKRVGEIIDAAFPALMFIYPITIVLILLNVVSNRWASSRVFRGVVLVTFLFSIPDFFKSIEQEHILESITPYIPLSSQSLGWVIPAVLTFVILNLVRFRRELN
jgi:LIVCS family branched-chain amino acid:cation transporter